MKKKEHDFYGVPVKDIYTEPNHKKTSDKLKLRDILKDKLPIPFKCQGLESERKTEELFEIKGDKEKCDF